MLRKKCLPLGLGNFLTYGKEIYETKFWVITTSGNIQTMQKSYYIKLRILTAQVGNGERMPSLLVTELKIKQLCRH